MSSDYSRGYAAAQSQQMMNDLMQASVDAGAAWAQRHSRQPQQPAVVLESDYLLLRKRFYKVVADAKEIAAQRDIYLDAIRAFLGRVLDRDEINTYMRHLAKERGVPWRG